MSHPGSTTFPGRGRRCSGNKLLGKSARKVKLFHRYKRGDPRLWKRGAFQALLAPLQGPGSPAMDAQCLGWLKLFGKITPKCLRCPEMTRCFWRRRPAHGEEKWQSHSTARISLSRPQASTGSNLQAGGDEEDDEEEDEGVLNSREEEHGAQTGRKEMEPP